MEAKTRYSGFRRGLSGHSTVTFSPTAQCPANFVNFGEPSMPICLYFLQSKNTFFGTRQVCQALSADLAKLTGDLHEDVAQYINMHSGERKTG